MKTHSNEEQRKWIFLIGKPGDMYLHLFNILLGFFNARERANG